MSLVALSGHLVQVGRSCWGAGAASQLPAVGWMLPPRPRRKLQVLFRAEKIHIDKPGLVLGSPDVEWALGMQASPCPNVTRAESQAGGKLVRTGATVTI